VEQQELRIRYSAGEREGKNGTYQIVISNATAMSSFRINAVNEMGTIFKNSFSNIRGL